MAFLENEMIYLEDANGKRSWVRVSYGMVKVQSLGAIDGSRFKDLEEGDVITIVGREYTVFRPGIMELMESLDRGAQVIIPKDAATILLKCDVKCGDIGGRGRFRWTDHRTPPRGRTQRTCSHPGTEGGERPEGR